MPGRKRKPAVVRCLTCKDHRLEEIDRAIHSGTSARQIALAFELNHVAISRHKKHYQSRTKSEVIRATSRAQVAVDNYSIPNVIDLTDKANVLSELSQVYAHQKRMFLRAEHSSDFRAAARALSDSKDTLSLFARVHGLVSGDGPSVVLNMTSETAMRKLEQGIAQMTEAEMRDFLVRGKSVDQLAIEAEEKQAMIDHVQSFRNDGPRNVTRSTEENEPDGQ